MASAKTNSPSAAAALEQLLGAYWYPIYVYIRRRGYSPEDAEDLTQEFFARLLAGHGLEKVNPLKGKFHSYLLASVNHLLCDEHDRAIRLKRGAGQRPIAFDALTTEERYRLEPASEEAPEKSFERQWAVALVEKVRQSLEQEYAAAGNAGLFTALKHHLVPEDQEMDYQATAQRLNMTEGALRTALHRLRRRFGELFRTEVANTLAEPGELKAEMHYLLKVFST